MVASGSSSVGRPTAAPPAASAAIELDVDHRVVPELLEDRGEALQQPDAAQQLGPQPEDEIPDVLDRQVEVVDRPLHAPLDLGGIVADELRDVLERQPDRVQALDDAVVEILADALPLVDDGQQLGLLVEARVLDRDARVEGEGLDEPLVVLGELVGSQLVGQVEVADRRAVDGDRDAEKAVHVGVVRREAVAPRVGRDVPDPERAVLAHDQAQEAAPARQRTDPGPLLRVDPGRDESLDVAVRADDAQGRIARPDERPNLVDDDLQDVVDRLEAGDRPGRGIERLDDPGRRAGVGPSRCADRPAHDQEGSRSTRALRTSECAVAGRSAPHQRAAWPKVRAKRRGTMVEW